MRKLAPDWFQNLNVLGNLLYTDIILLEVFERKKKKTNPNSRSHILYN